MIFSLMKFPRKIQRISSTRLIRATVIYTWSQGWNEWEQMKAFDKKTIGAIISLLTDW